MRRLTLHSFFVIISPKTQRISFHNHHIRLICLRMTSGYSPNSKDHSEDTVLTRLKRYKPNQRRLWRQFRKSNSTSVSTIGKKRCHKCIISGGDDPQYYEWYSAFKSGQYVVEDLLHSGWPSTTSTEVNIAKVKKIVTKNRHLSLREIAAKLFVYHESIRTILYDCLGMKRFAARLDPKELNFFQKLNHVKTKNWTNIIEQLPYSPDMAPADFFIFPKLKLPLRGTRFQSTEDWIIRWHKWIISGGAYFESDKINLDQ